MYECQIQHSRLKANIFKLYLSMLFCRHMAAILTILRKTPNNHLIKHAANHSVDTKNIKVTCMYMT